MIVLIMIRCSIKISLCKTCAKHQLWPQYPFAYSEITHRVTHLFLTLGLGDITFIINVKDIKVECLLFTCEALCHFFFFFFLHPSPFPFFSSLAYFLFSVIASPLNFTWFFTQVMVIKVTFTLYCEVIVKSSHVDQKEEMS